jgi:hypothetical protein
MAMALEGIVPALARIRAIAVRSPACAGRRRRDIADM